MTTFGSRIESKDASRIPRYYRRLARRYDWEGRVLGPPSRCAGFSTKTVNRLFGAVPKARKNLEHHGCKPLLENANKVRRYRWKSTIFL